jgi:hypothetical protein
VVPKDTDVFFAGGVGGEVDRWSFVNELRRHKPTLRYALHGREKRNRLLGDAYYQAIKHARVGLNLNRHEGDLYASDRMAQYLGNGLLVASARQSGYERYFSEDEMIFFNNAIELGDKVDWAISNDCRWRRMAELGRAKAIRMMEGQRVADFIMRMAFGWDEPQDWSFGSEIYMQPSPRSVSVESSFR